MSFKMNENIKNKKIKFTTINLQIHKSDIFD